MRSPRTLVPALLISILIGGWAHTPDEVSEGSDGEPLEIRACNETDLDSFDSPPRTENPARVADRMERLYRERGLADGGFGETARVCLVLDATGVQEARWLVESTGITALDRIALDVARTMEFSPAVVEGEPVAATLMVPLTFGRR
jgi:TonB family protein